MLPEPSLAIVAVSAPWQPVMQEIPCACIAIGLSHKIWLSHNMAESVIGTG